MANMERSPMPDPVAFSTRAAHAGRGALPRSVSRPLTPPIYQSTVYAFDRLEDLEALYAGAPGHIYYRQGTPTHAALEAAVAALEGAEAAVAAAARIAIPTAPVLAPARPGERIAARR